MAQVVEAQRTQAGEKKRSLWGTLTRIERPNFIPWMWGRGKRNRRLWNRPDKVMRWFVYALLGVGFLAALGWSGDDPVIRYAGLVGFVVIAWQALVYGPRAWRANRTRHRARPPSAP